MRRKSYLVPAWATKLIDKISDEEQVFRPYVTWQKVNRLGSHGSAWSNSIRITQGIDKKRTKETVIHEMCHVILGQKGSYSKNTKHGADFYAKLFEVGRRYRIGAAYIKAHETWYKPRGVRAGYRLYLTQQKGRD